MPLVLGEIIDVELVGWMIFERCVCATASVRRVDSTLESPRGAESSPAPRPSSEGIGRQLAKTEEQQPRRWEQVGFGGFKDPSVIRRKKKHCAGKKKKEL